ncbi:E3 ubiquitin-protein ligase RHF1A [Diplonema papillatum]|nr:E3 ubiquitin-protein ligase RHF1A [Diplonema papillatum]
MEEGPGMKKTASVMTMESSCTSCQSSFGEFGAYKQDTCSICLERYTASNPAMLYACGHAFHLQCAETWRQRSDTCPLCWGPLHETELYTGNEKKQQQQQQQRSKPKWPPAPYTPDQGAFGPADETEGLLSSSSGKAVAETPPHVLPCGVSVGISEMQLEHSVCSLDEFDTSHSTELEGEPRQDRRPYGMSPVSPIIGFPFLGVKTLG